ncbi:MAG TPA: GNAT family N-acetyltransferase [Nocardioides sp.]|nr:GNAT family N-acetyltransferase [Nocardioides sp.]
MELRSLAWRTDLALLQAAGSEVEDRGDHLVVRTPANPGFYWGNYLLLDAPAGPDEVPEWLRAFERVFPEAGHRTFGVDGADGSVDDLAPFRAAGMGVEASTVMTAQAVHEPAHPNTEATIRTLTTDEDWAQQVELALTDPELQGGRVFATRRAAAERRLVEQELGQWFGAFLDGGLAASLGLFVASEGLARYQGVMTHPELRGRGLCGTLVHHAGRFGFDELGVDTLVMVADPDYLAIRIYRSVGFTGSETQLQAMRVPKA